MKKLEDMNKEKESEHGVFDASANTSITCGCCNELPTVQPVTTRKEGEQNKSEDNEYDESRDTATIKRRGLVFDLCSFQGNRIALRALLMRPSVCKKYQPNTSCTK
jgi:hypothetical protein